MLKARLIALGALVLLAAAAVLAQGFRIDASADTLLTDDNPDYIATRQAAERYAPEEFILVAFAPQNERIFAPETLQTVAQLGEELAQLPRVERVRSLVNVPLFTGLTSIDGDIDPSALTWEARRYPEAEFAKNLRKHPLYESLLFNEDYTALALQVVFKDDPELSEIDARITKLQARRLKDELSAEQGAALENLTARAERIDERLAATRAGEIDRIRVLTGKYAAEGEFYLGGNNLLAKQLIEIIRSDLVVFGSAIFALASLALLALFRQLRWVVLPMVCCAASVVYTLGLLSALELKVTVISANVIALQIILTLAVLLHLVVHYEELQTDTEPGEAGRGHEPATAATDPAVPPAAAAGGEQAPHRRQAELVTAMLKAKAGPCFYAGITTCIGFGALIFSGVAPVVSFGWMMALAMGVTLLTCLVLFPALLLGFFKPRRPRPAPRWAAALIGAAARAAEGRGGIILGGCALLMVLGVLGCLRLSAENSFINYFSKSTDVYRELAFIDQKFGGSTALDILYTVPEAERNPDLILTAVTVQNLQALHQRLERRDAVGSITSIYDFTRVAEVIREVPVTEYELTALYNTLDPALRQDLFGAYLDAEARQLRVSLRIKDTEPDLDRSELLAGIEDDLRAAGIAPDNYRLTNVFVLYQQVLAQLVNSQFLTLGIVYAAMGLALLLVFRSVKLALIGLAPNIITTALILGALGLLGIPLDLMTMTIAAVATGIGIDDTIHYVHRYRAERKVTGAQSAVARAHATVGRAMLYTSAVVVVGFGALWFSDFVPSRMFGLLTAFAMLAALVLNGTLLPVLLARFVKNRVPEGTP